MDAVEEGRDLGHLPHDRRPSRGRLEREAHLDVGCGELGPGEPLALAELAKREWFAGPEFTAADIQMSFPLEAASARAPLVRQMPKLAAFLDRIHARPAYKRALAKGGPYELMK